MRNKMTANKKIMPIEVLKKVYMQSWVSNNILIQLELWLRENNSRPFATANKMFDMLTFAFDNSNWKQMACTKYWTLRQRDQEFKNFWAKFQWLAVKLDYSKETLIDDLIKKCHYIIQQ